MSRNASVARCRKAHRSAAAEGPTAAAGLRRMEASGHNPPGRSHHQRRRCLHSRAEEAATELQEPVSEVVPGMGVPAMPGAEMVQEEDWPEGVAYYRRKTEALLRQYLRMAMLIGRMPSCVPREHLAARTQRLRFYGVEDAVIFVHDMERSFHHLDQLSVVLLQRIAVQEYTHREAAKLLGMRRSTLGRCYDDALDSLSTVLLQKGILVPQR